MAQTKQRPRRTRTNPKPVAPVPGAMVFTVPEAAYVLECSVPTVWLMLRNEVLPRTRIGRHTRISRTAVQAYIDGGGGPSVHAPYSVVQARKAAG